MDENSKLFPTFIMNQCNKAISNINRDLLALDVANTAIQNFLDDKSLKATSFDKLKEFLLLTLVSV